jgi:uncharacterized lipoprotein YddW (UPF0748 family)
MAPVVPEAPKAGQWRSIADWLSMTPEAKKSLPKRVPVWTADTSQWEDLPEAKPDTDFPVSPVPSLVGQLTPAVAAMSVDSNNEGPLASNLPESPDGGKTTGKDAGDGEPSFDDIIKFETTDTSAPPVERPRFNVDYGTYSQKMRILDEYRVRIYEAMELANAIDFGIPKRQLDDMVYDADRLKSDFQTAYLNSRTWDDADAADKIYDQAKIKMLQAMVVATPSPKVEGRAIWLDRGSIVRTATPDGMRALIRRLAETGINMVYYEAINAGYALYPSQQLVENPEIKAQNWDPLAVAVDEGHKLGIEVHAWVWCFAVGNQRHNVLIGKPRNYVGPVLEDKGLMSETLRMGSGSIMPPRQTEYWLSPASPKARQFLVEAYDEIVSKYQVDGLQLDYIRYPFQRVLEQAGYENIGRSRFAAETGRSIGGGDGDSYRLWLAWKTQQVNTFVEQVSTMLKSKQRNLKLSAAVFPMSRVHRILAIQQDWETWINKGWVDALNPMNYARSEGRFKRTLGNVLEYADNQALVYSGLAIDRVNEAQMLDQIWATRELGAQGATLFANVHLDDAKAFVLKDGAYKVRPAIPPHHDPQTAFVTVFRDLKPRMDKALEKIGYAPQDMAAPTQTAGEPSSGPIPQASMLQATAIEPTSANSANATNTNNTPADPTITILKPEPTTATPPATSAPSNAPAVTSPATAPSPVVSEPVINEPKVHQDIRNALADLEKVLLLSPLPMTSTEDAAKTASTTPAVLTKPVPPSKGSKATISVVPVADIPVATAIPAISPAKVQVPLSRLVKAFDQWQQLHRKSSPLLAQYFDAQLSQLQQLANYWQRQLGSPSSCDLCLK